MARAHTKCSMCNDILWFGDNDPVPQDVICPCGTTQLTEDGPQGSHIDLTEEEIAELP